MIPFIGARALTRTFNAARKNEVQAVREVSLSLVEGQRIGLIGSSGSGKTTLAKLLLGLDSPTSGEVIHRGIPLSKTNMRVFRSEVQVVFQDPRSSLDPQMSIADIVREPLECLAIDGDHDHRIQEVLRLVGLADDIARRRPHQLSGGQRQRVAIARALAPRPRLLIADEPVSALDALVRDEILDLLENLTTQLGLGLLLVSHDLAVIARTCSEVLVMHGGEIVERGSTRDVFRQPQNAHTGALLAAVPRFA